MAPASVRTKLLRELLAFGIAIPIFLALLWLGLVRHVRNLAGDRAQQVMQSLDQRLSEYFAHVQHGVASLAFLWQEGAIDPSHPEATRLQALAALEQAPEMGLVMLVALPSGPGFYVRRIGAEDQVRIFRPIDDEHSIVDIVWSNAGGASRPAEHLTESYHPVRRPWVDTALRRGGATWTEPYLFPRLGGLPPETVGITHGVPVHSREGKLIGVAGADLRLDDLSGFARAVRPTPGSELVVLDGQDHVIASSVMPSGGGRPRYLETPTQEDLPVVRALIASGASSDSAIQELRHSGTTWFGRTYPIAAMTGQGWRFALAIPEAELIGSARNELLALFAAVSFIFALAAWRVSAVTRHLAASLHKLAAAAKEVSGAGPLDLPSSQLTEIGELSAALEAARASVQEQKQLEQQLLHSQRVALVGFLAGTLAHDVNNQLTAVIAGLAAAQARVKQESPATAALLAEVEEACWQSVEVIRGLLGLSRRDANLKSVDVNSVVSRTASTMTRLLDRRVRVELRLAESLPLLTADPVQLEQVLLNLALNARDAMPLGGTLRFQTSNAPPGFVQLSVADTGTGMSPDVQKRVFEPFFTTKEAGKGTGLGLAIASSIVRGYGGSIEVQSEVGKGSTFHIRLRC